MADEEKQAEPVVREEWNSKLEFILTCVGYAVGLGNVWRFPYLCYKNGGGAFLIPYTLMLAVVGLPLFFMEFAFGQFASLGPISVWKISPLFKGVGYAMVLLSWYICLYYNIIIAQCFHFFIASMRSVLPWSDCGNSWNNEKCFTSNMHISNMTNSVSASEQYYENYVLRISPGLEDFGTPSWQMALSLLICWIIVCLVLLKGIQSLGKVAYFTAIFPYFILTILLIRGLTLPGAIDGIYFYMKPQFHRLKDPKVWTDAATQIFFSLSCCNGGLIAMSSYNKFKNNCCRDAVIVAVLNCATSVFAGFVIFANLGFMAYVKNVPVETVAKGGPGLAFVVYPEALSNMPFAPLWAVLFFFMMLTLGLGSQFSIVETILSGVQDEMNKIGYFTQAKVKIIFRIIVCVICFLLGLPMTAPGGMYLLNLLDSTVSGCPLLFVALAEVVIVCYLYGIHQFEHDVELMTGSRPNWYWRSTWCFLSPVVIIGLLIFYFAFGDNLSYGNYQYPQWALSLSSLIAFSPLILIFGVFAFRYCREGGWILMKEYLKPKQRWGPADQLHREEFLQVIRSCESLQGKKASCKDLIAIGEHAQHEHSEKHFFQSKMHAAEKLTKAASKEELNKKGLVKSFTAGTALSPEVLALAATLHERACLNRPSLSVSTPDIFSTQISKQ